jgi:hypothetical protein
MAQVVVTLTEVPYGFPQFLQVSDAIIASTFLPIQNSLIPLFNAI